MTACLIIKTIILLGLAGYQIIIIILALSYVSRWLSFIFSAPSLYANLRVPTRVYDAEGGAIFSKNSTFVFFDGAAWTPRLRSPSPIMAPDAMHFMQAKGIQFCLSKSCSVKNVEHLSVNIRPFVPTASHRSVVVSGGAVM